jgi:aminopeptidase N
MQTVSRLINQFAPHHYNLSIALDRVERQFSGTVTIEGESADGLIAVHAKELVIEDVLIDGKKAISTKGENDELNITQDGLSAGKHIVVIGFSGVITDGMHGLYPCYFEHDGTKKELLATQFESHHAREVFPCIDEPEAKATFDVTLTTEDDVTVLGNMPTKQQNVQDGKLVTVFETTPKMSVYLLAWVVGELQRKTATTKSGVEVNVWSTPAHKPESLDFALNEAVNIIDFFDEYFDTPYPLPKCDHVALPDFESGAMENWGLITYRELALLADPKTTSISVKHYISTVVAHELSHQWFGNLVTMKWWNNLWLNESFANLMEYVAVDALHPEWDIWLDYSSQETIMALRRDSIDGVQAVQVEVSHPDEISTLFDGAIVYAKGGRLLRMLQKYIGNEAFQTGLKSYFLRYAYGNTEGEDLWNELAEASGKSIADFMNTWISQSGYPVLHASQSGDQLSLSQEQFFTGPHKPSKKLWPIPLLAVGDELPTLFDTKSTTITRKTKNTLRFNDGDSAHFLTHYDSAMLKSIVDEVEALSPLGRLQLLHEQVMLARGEVMSNAELIPLLDAYKNEATEHVWDIMALTTGELKKFVENDEKTEKKLRNLAGKLARQQYERLGWDTTPNEPENDIKLRPNILGMMVYAENADVITKAAEVFANNDIENLDPELRTLILSTVVRHRSTPEIVDMLMARYKTASSAELQQDIAFGLTSTKDPAVVDRLLVQLSDTSVVRPQDVARWFVYLVRGRESRTQTWQWMRDNWKWIEETFGSGKSLDDFPRYAASGLRTIKELEEYKSFFGPMQDMPALKRVIATGISEIEGRVALIERDKDAVRTALRALS